jgi:hypothetical protein
MTFCKRHASEGPTEKDAILGDFRTAAFSEDEKVSEVQDIQNQVDTLILHAPENKQKMNGEWPCFYNTMTS